MIHTTVPYYNIYKSIDKNNLILDIDIFSNVFTSCDIRCTNWCCNIYSQLYRWRYSSTSPGDDREAHTTVMMTLLTMEFCLEVVLYSVNMVALVVSLT